MTKNQADISIESDSFEYLLHEYTGNPIADDEIPEMLRRALNAGKSVFLTESDGRATYKLALSDTGKFQYIALD